MENDLLRRQYDMENVILHRSGEYMSFEVPGLKDISPPIRQHDMISATDVTDPKGMVPGKLVNCNSQQQ